MTEKTERRRVVYAKIEGQDIRHVLPKGLKGELHTDKYKKLAIVTMPKCDLLPPDAIEYAKKVQEMLAKEPFFQDGVTLLVCFEGTTFEFFDEDCPVEGDDD